MTTNGDDTRTFSGWIDRELLGGNGEKIGKINSIYVDDDTAEPEWLGVKTGLFGTHVSLVPLTSATVKGDALSVPYTKDQVKDAPRVDPDESLSVQEEGRLYRHYGLAYSESRSESGLPQGSRDDAMTRSEEELQVGKTAREAGRVHLRKWVETEQVSASVPIAREEVRIEREPVTEGNIDRTTSGPEISEAEQEVVLHEEQAVVAKQAVPKERVRLVKDVVTEEEEVSAELRKERIAVEGDGAEGKHRG